MVVHDSCKVPGAARAKVSSPPWDEGCACRDLSGWRGWEMLRKTALFVATLACILLPAGCIGGSGTPKSAPASYVLTVISTSPASGAAIAVTPADNNNAAGGATAFTRTYSAGTAVTLTAAATSNANSFQSWSGCTQASALTCSVTMNTDTTVTANYGTSQKITPTVTVTPSPAIVSTGQGFTVTVAVSGPSGDSVPTGTVKLTSGAYASAAATLANGSAIVNFPAGSLPQGSDTLTATYTPDTASSSTYNGTTGTAWVTVTAPAYTLTVDSTGPASGVAIAVAPADNNNATAGSTSFTRSYYAGTTVTLSAPTTAGGNPFVAWSGCTSASTVLCTVAMNANTTVTAKYLVPIVAPTVTVTPSATSITTAQALQVTVAVSGGAGNPVPTGSIILTSGAYASAATALVNGSATISLPAGSLTAGSDVLKAAYTPDSVGAANYNSSTGTAVVTVTIPVYTLSVASVSPASGVAIAVTPADNNNAAGGTTAFTRAYNAGSSVTLTAPATSGNYSFFSWSGCASASSITCKVTMNANTTVTANYVPITYTLTVNSASPSSGVAIGVTPADNNKAAGGATTFTRTYNAGSSVTLTAPATAGNYSFVAWSGCTSTSTVTCTVAINSNTAVRATYAPTIYTLTVNSTDPSSGVAIGATPADNNSATGGTTGFALSYNAGTSVTLTAPATANTVAFRSWSGCASAATVTCTVAMGGNTTVTANYGKLTPTVTVTPSLASITTLQDLKVPVTVSGDSGDPAPTGSVIVTSGSYTSAAATLSNGSASFTIPAGSLAVGSDTLKVTYTPDVAGSALYNSATGTSSAVTVVAASSVTVDPLSVGPVVTSQILGMNMAAWVDPTLSAILPALQAAGIKTIRWPGGSWADNYHWAGNTLCNGSPNSNATFDKFISNLVTPGDFDVALTANYGTGLTDSTSGNCGGSGDPTEAAAWAAYALANGGHVSHITVGNEDYGSWETDNHPLEHDATTYAAATATGYYPLIKAADPNVLVGVSVNAGDTSSGNSAGWDPIVLAQATYDFVEYHFYAQAPGKESDTYLVQQAAQALTTNLKTIKAELATAGKPDTPIFIGEIGSVYSNPGKQTSSITQALYAGQALGEMMNEGVSYATWWLGFGGCSDASGGNNFSTSLYGFQNFGGYMVFSDGTPEYGCSNATAVPIGTLLPSARAFQLFSQVAVDGENVLTATVAGDTTDVRVYAATHSGGTALVLFNLNELASEAVVVTLNGQSTTSGGTITTYSKALYDQSKSNVWAAPTTTTISSQSLPLTLTLDPWSMNVVLLK